MATFTSKATGNWSSGGQTTWNEVGVPGNGDTVTIGTGHAITVDTNTTVGSSPAAGGTAAIAVNSTGTLIIASSVTLTSRGDIKLTDTTLTMNSGSTLEFDASAAGSPSTALYVLQIGTASASPNALFIVNGTSGSHCTLRSNSGGANARVTNGGFVQAGQVSATYLDCLRIGDSTHDSFITHCQGDEGTFHLTNCVLDACGRINTDVLNELGEFVLTDVTMKNSVGTRCLRVAPVNNITVGHGLRSITGCVFDQMCTFFTGLDFTIQNNVFYDGAEWTSALPADVSGNLFRRRDAQGQTGGMNTYMGLTNCYVLYDDASATNPHFLNPDPTLGDMAIDGCVFEFTGTDGTGDLLLCTAPSAAHTLTVKNCIKLPNAGDTSSGTLVSALGGANLTISMQHNTVHEGNTDAGNIENISLRFGETYNSHAGMISSLTNNLGWDTSTRGYLAGNINASPNTDVVTSANANYNGKYNLSGTGYFGFVFSSGSPGANDVTGNPQFVDSARDMAKWDTSLGGAGTVANALTELMKRNQSGYNTAYTIAALLTYVKAGFAPQNTSYQAANDSVSPSNGWIGAVEGIAAAATTFWAGHQTQSRIRRSWRM